MECAKPLTDAHLTAAPLSASCLHQDGDQP
jgi:hypothetical protein